MRCSSYSHAGHYTSLSAFGRRNFSPTFHPRVKTRGTQVSKLRRVKALYWDKDGYVLWYKRLEQGQFIIPGGEGIEIDRTEWMHMLEGMDVKIMKRQPRYRVSDGKKIK